jgi:hypothetical protein
VITDLTATSEYFEVEGMQKQRCHGGMLKTAENIYQIIMEHNLLVDAFQKSPVKPSP